MEAWKDSAPDGFYKPNLPDPSDHFYSYALPTLLRTGAVSLTWEGRMQQWSDSASSSAVVVSDRLTGPADPNTDLADVYDSVWTDGTGQGWEGGISYNDNHVEFVSSALVRGTDYGKNRGGTSAADNIFSDRAGTDPRVGAGAEQGWEARQVSRGFSSSKFN